MRGSASARCACLLVLWAATGWSAGVPLGEQTLTAGGVTRTLQVAEGLVVELLVEGLDGPRFVAAAPDRALFIGSKSGRVYRVPAPYAEAQTFLQLPGYPHSLAFQGERLLIAKTDGLFSVAWRSGLARAAAADVKRVAYLTARGGHNTRSVGVGPDDRVYLSLGISGNCSDEYLSNAYPSWRRRGGIVVLDESRTPARWTTFASGLRNPVGFAWHPQTGVLYATNNGPDHLGYDAPPEYFSALAPDSFHGMPWYQFDGRALVRDTCISSEPPRATEDVTLPAATFPARNAPMGVAFAAHGGLLDAFSGDAIVALRGSWATSPTGGGFGDPATRRPAKLVRVHFQSGQPTGEVSDIVTGFQLADGRRWARPVGVLAGPDGAVYFTSDEGVNGLFRLRRK